MKFNQQLITKARKGEIAILNDGSVEELRAVINAVWPNDNWEIGGHTNITIATPLMTNII